MSGSTDKELREKLAKAMVKATELERARALSCLDHYIEDLNKQFKRKLLIETERHTIETKMRIAQAICRDLRFMIVSGRRPDEEATKAP
jgi:hypothetical protein